MSRDISASKRPELRILISMAAKTERVTLTVAGREVAVSNPDKVYFPEARITKLELVQY